MGLTEGLYALSYRKAESLVELTWLPGTTALTDQDFREVLTVFADAAVEHRAKRLIIDVRKFLSRPSAEVLAWRDQAIVPKYEKAGVRRLAWIWPGAAVGETGTGAGYQQRYFETRDEALVWLLARN
jgi:hypothetical protein